MRVQVAEIFTNTLKESCFFSVVIDATASWIRIFNVESYRRQTSRISVIIPAKSWLAKEI